MGIADRRKHLAETNTLIIEIKGGDTPHLIIEATVHRNLHVRDDHKMPQTFSLKRPETLKGSKQRGQTSRGKFLGLN